jgi:beta-lactam-binding protein with PASTA domain
MTRSDPRRLRVAVLPVLAVAALAAGCGGSGSAVATTRAPGVVGLDTARALARIRRHGLVPRIARRLASQTVARGVVVSQHPSADARVARGAVVFLVVSSGREAPVAPPPPFG